MSTMSLALMEQVRNAPAATPVKTGRCCVWDGVVMESKEEKCTRPRDTMPGSSSVRAKHTGILLAFALLSLHACPFFPTIVMYRPTREVQGTVVERDYVT